MMKSKQAFVEARGVRRHVCAMPRQAPAVIAAACPPEPLFAIYSRMPRVYHAPEIREGGQPDIAPFPSLFTV